jgi:citrate lyase subunit beta / citryl-CoA lyase
VHRNAIAAARSMLFVPGDRPDRFAKAVASGADAVVLDLEDAVAPEHKAGGRSAAAAWLRDGGDALVRVNAPGTEWFESDIQELGELGVPVMLPKATPQSLAQLARTCTHDLPVVALVESAAGCRSVDEIATAAGVVRLALGTIDLAAELGVDPVTSPLMDVARAQVAMASAAAGIAGPVDGVTVSINDEAALRADLARAMAYGLSGKLCIHPNQVSVVGEVLAPPPSEVAWARRVLDGVREADGGVFVLDGQMVDRPVVVRARWLLERAGETDSE